MQRRAGKVTLVEIRFRRQRYPKGSTYDLQSEVEWIISWTLAIGSEILEKIGAKSIPHFQG